MVRTGSCLRRLASAAILAAVLVPVPGVTGGEARAEIAAASSPLARLLGREQAAFEAVGNARVQSLVAEHTQPRPRAKVTVATRGTAPEAQSVRPAARVLDAAALDALPPASGDGQWQCLAAAIYFEARGEPIAGQIAVAEVVLNRVDDRTYPNSICAVTNQGVGSGRACQFSYACDGRPDVMRAAVSKQRAEKLARILLDGQPRSITEGATHFHATYVRPGWARQFTRTAAIGNHVFYRQPTRVASN